MNYNVTQTDHMSSAAQMELVILAKIKHKHIGYKVYVMDCKSHVVFRIISSDSHECIHFGCVDQNSTIVKCDIGEKIRVGVYQPVEHDYNLYYPIDEDSIQRRFDLDVYKFISSGKCYPKPDHIYSVLNALCNFEENINNTVLLYVKNGKILEHRQKKGRISIENI